jgi:CRISPR-associated protein Cmr2
MLVSQANCTLSYKQKSPSATSGGETIQYLLSIALGPVQDFIATARRTRDLWFGSYLLSEASKAAAKTIGKDNLIFPSPMESADLDAGSGFNVVNKLLAVIQGDQKTVLEVASQSRDAAIERLLELLKQPLSDLKLSNAEITTAREQVKDLLEFYWAAVPFDGSNYEAARNQVELALAFRKNTREFSPVTWGSGRPKSSLDGARETVIEELNSDTRLEYGIRENEQLDGTGILKRLGNRGAQDEERFLSTSHVAAGPYLDRIVKNPDAMRLFRDYVQKLRTFGIKPSKIAGRNTGNWQHLRVTTGEYDGHSLFAERLRDYLKWGSAKDTSEKRREKTRIAEVNLEKAKSALEEFFRTVSPKIAPHPYYAILLADGDRMGKAIEAAAKQNGLQKHREISRKLSEFAADVDDIVLEHGGSTIYAGGDDVLALVPMHRVLECAEKLAVDFKAKLNDFSYRECDDKSGKPTLSVGVVIAHHLDPLQDSLETVRRSEKAAKKYRQALAVTVSKRSGNDTTVAGQWANSSFSGNLKFGSIYKRLTELTDFHVQGDIPDGLAYELRECAHGFSDAAAHQENLAANAQGISQTLIQTTNEEQARLEQFQRIIKLETMRICARKSYRTDDASLAFTGRPKSRNNQPQPGVTNTMFEDLLKFANNASDATARSDETPLGKARRNLRTVIQSLEQFANEIIVAREFAVADKLANPISNEVIA